jgi:type I restriction enzyme M protein
MSLRFIVIDTNILISAALSPNGTPDRFEQYKKLLLDLGSTGSGLVQEIFANATSFIRKLATLSSLVTEIEKLDWYSGRRGWGICIRGY